MEPKLHFHACHVPAASASSPCYTWEFPGCPVRIRIRLDVVRELRRRFAEPRRLAPPCGLLMGDASASGITEITAFLPLVSVQPSDVSDAIGRCGRGVVGFYRSKDAPPLTLSTDDLALARRHFQDPGSVILLVESGPSGPGNAVFFFWDHGTMNGDLPLLEFPFDPEQLCGAEPAPESPAVSPAALSAPSSARFPLRFLITAAVLASGAMAGYWYGQAPPPAPAARPAAVQPKPAPPPPSASLGLSVERKGAGLTLTWNREAPIVTAADFGMLVATENQQRRNIPLTPEQLRAGTLTLHPAAPEVELRLNVIAGDKLAAESMLVLSRIPAQQQRDSDF